MEYFNIIQFKDFLVDKVKEKYIVDKIFNMIFDVKVAKRKKKLLKQFKR